MAERIFCPTCLKSGNLSITLLSKKLRCRCGTEFCPLEYIPQYDFPDERGDFETLAVRGTYYSAVGYANVDDSFTVVRGSLYLKDHTSGSCWYPLRKALIADGPLKFDVEHDAYVGMEDVIFPDTESALSVVSGGTARTKQWSVVKGIIVLSLAPDADSEVHQRKHASPGSTVETHTEYHSMEDAKPDFLGMTSAQLESLIVTVLERRPNNSVKREELVAEVLREIGVRTSGTPRKKFERKVLHAARRLSDQNVVDEYRSKNKRIRLSEHFRRLAAKKFNNTSDTIISTPAVISSGSKATADPYTVEALKAQNARLRRMVAELAMDSDLNLNLDVREY